MFGAIMLTVIRYRVYRVGTQQRDYLAEVKSRFDVLVTIEAPFNPVCSNDLEEQIAVVYHLAIDI